MSENQEKIVLLQAWADVIQKDIENLATDRETKFKEYKANKEVYDRRIAAKLKIVTKVDKFINDRKKALEEVRNEIRSLEEPMITIITQPITGSVEIPPTTV